MYAVQKHTSNRNQLEWYQNNWFIGLHTIVGTHRYVRFISYSPKKCTNIISEVIEMYIDTLYLYHWYIAMPLMIIIYSYLLLHFYM